MFYIKQISFLSKNYILLLGALSAGKYSKNLQPWGIEFRISNLPFPNLSRYAVILKEFSAFSRPEA